MSDYGIIRYGLRSPYFSFLQAIVEAEGPSPADTEPRIWWDFSDQAFLTLNGSRITAVTDLSTNHWINTISTNPILQPTSQQVASWNNLYGAVMSSSDGGNDTVSTTITDGAAQTAQPFTWVSLFRTSSTISELEQLYGTTATDQASLSWSGVGGQPHGFAGSAASRYPSTLATNTTYIDITIFNGSSSITRINGTPGTAYNPGATIISSDEGTGFGLFNLSFSPPSYTMGEFLYYRRALASSESEFLEGYLAHKFDQAAVLPSSHPYKSAPP